MSSLVESTHHFDERCKEVGLTAPTRRSLAALGLTTLSKLAYSVGQPGQPIAGPEWEAFVASHFSDIALGEQAGLRRLVFESQTLLLSDLREQVTRPEHWAQRPIPPAERQKSMNAVRASVPGVLIEGPLEPAHCLLESACRMEREGQVRYIAPSKCATRLQEIQEGRSSSATKVIEVDAGKLAAKEEKELADSPCGSAILVQEALRRRGVALQFAGVCTFLQHEKYLLKLFAHMAREPPAGCQRTSVHQLVLADQAVWARLVEDDVSPKRDASGDYPVGAALLPTLMSYEVTIILLARPIAQAEGRKRHPSGPSRPNAQKFLKTTQKGAEGKGSGKTAKGKGATPFQRIPEGIRSLGVTGLTPDGKRICFDKNLEQGCAADPCPKGVHVCAKCFSPDHTLQNCPKRKKP